VIRTAHGRRSTIYDIAKAANASVTTVSFVLTGSWSRHRIKEETAQRILGIADRLGYNVNLKARGLRLSRSGLAGMILPHYRNRFFADIAETFEAEARKRDLCPVVVSTQRQVDIESRVAKTLLDQRVEFMFIVGVPQATELDRMCDLARVPCVNIDLPGNGAPSVVSDNKNGALHLTQRLIGELRMRGGSPKDFFFLGGIAGEYATDNRIAGFFEALRQEGVTPGEHMLACCGYRPSNARAALKRYLDRNRHFPSGLFVNSITAFEGVAQLSGGGAQAALRDCVVGCFDWDPFAAQLPFTVVMMRQDVETMLEAAFTLLDPARQSARDVVMVPLVIEPNTVQPATAPAAVRRRKRAAS
jgi:LacI family transcriptional regulator, fructose operon transcriptional repressor